MEATAQELLFHKSWKVVTSAVRPVWEQAQSCKKQSLDRDIFQQILKRTNSQAGLRSSSIIVTVLFIKVTPKALIAIRMSNSISDVLILLARILSGSLITMI